MCVERERERVERPCVCVCVYVLERGRNIREREGQREIVLFLEKCRNVFCFVVKKEFFQFVSLSY